MSDLFWLTDEQMAKLSPFFPKSHGKLRVDDRRVLIGRTNGGVNTNLHAICDGKERPIDLFVTAGQLSDYVGARALLSGLQNVKWLLGGHGYDADWFRDALKDKGIRACIPGRKQRNQR